MRHSWLTLFFISLLWIPLAFNTNSHEVASNAVTGSQGLQTSDHLKETIKIPPAGEAEKDVKSIENPPTHDEENSDTPKPAAQEEPVTVPPPPVVQTCKEVCEENKLVWLDLSPIPDIPEDTFSTIPLENNDKKTKDENTNNVVNLSNDLSPCACFSEKVAEFFQRDYKRQVRKTQEIIYTNFATEVHKLNKFIYSRTEYMQRKAADAKQIHDSEKFRTDSTYRKNRQLERCLHKLSVQNQTAAENREKWNRKATPVPCVFPDLSGIYLKKTVSLKKQMDTAQNHIINEMVRISVYYQHYVNRFAQYNSKCSNDFKNEMSDTGCKEKNNNLRTDVKKSIEDALKIAAGKVQLLSDTLQTQFEKQQTKEGKEVEKKKSEKKEEKKKEAEKKKSEKNEEKKMAEQKKSEAKVAKIKSLGIKTKPYVSGIKYYYAILQPKESNSCDQECTDIKMILGSETHFPTVLPGFVRYKDAFNNEINATITSDFVYIKEMYESTYCFCEDFQLKIDHLRFTYTKLLGVRVYEKVLKGVIKKINDTHATLLSSQESRAKAEKKLAEKEAKEVNELQTKIDKCTFSLEAVTEENENYLTSVQITDSKKDDPTSQQTMLSCDEKLEMEKEPFEKEHTKKAALFSEKLDSGNTELMRYYRRTQLKLRKLIKNYMNKKECLGIMVGKEGICTRMYPQTTIDKNTKEKLPLLHDDLNKEIEKLFENHKDLDADTELKTLKKTFNEAIITYRTNNLLIPLETKKELIKDEEEKVKKNKENEKSQSRIEFSINQIYDGIIEEKKKEKKETFFFKIH